LSYLLDTSIAIHLRERQSHIVQKFELLSEPPFISVVTQVELEGGIYAPQADAEGRREAVDALLEILPAIPFDAHTATLYGHIIARSGFNRRKLVDRMIAATALAHDLTLITANGSDFADIEGLTLMVWNT
jgi:tRNA(fMet)-specific endonuclease VapC